MSQPLSSIEEAHRDLWDALRNVIPDYMGTREVADAIQTMLAVHIAEATTRILRASGVAVKP